MKLTARFKKLTFWNKVGVCGAIASLFAIPLGLIPLCTTKPATEGSLREFRCEMEQFRKQLWEQVSNGQMPIADSTLSSELADCLIGIARNALDSGLVEFARTHYKTATIHLSYALRTKQLGIEEMRDVLYYLGLAQSFQVPLCWPNWPPCYDERELGLLMDAVEFLDQCLQLDSANADAWCQKGMVLHQLLDYTQAINCFDKAITLRRHLARAWYYRAFSLSSIGQHGMAKASSDTAFMMDPQLLERTIPPYRGG